MKLATSKLAISKSGKNCLDLSVLSCFALSPQNFFSSLEMKTLALLILCVGSVVLADDFKTIDGKEYKNVTISRVEPDGIVLITKSGISKVYFTELPKEVQESFHYDAA